MAIGSYYDPNVDLNGLIEVLSNGAWTGMQAPNPLGVPAGQYGVFLTGVSCPSVGFCTITGEYSYGEPHQVQLFVDTLSGGSWTTSDAPLPSNAGPAYFENDTLESVDCPTAGWCEASGTYIDTNGQHDGLLENLSGGTWTATEAPAPTPTASDEEVNVGLSDITCPVVGSCEAIGSYNDLTQPPGQPFTSTPGQGILETLSDGAWSDISALQLPADADPARSSGLSAISCPTAGSCEGVGDYPVSGDSGDVSALVEGQSGESWTPTPVPLPSNADTTRVSFLSALSCPSAGSCLAVGEYTADDGTTQLLTEVLADGSWAATEGPLPVDADATPTRAGARCR